MSLVLFEILSESLVIEKVGKDELYKVGVCEVSLTEK